MYAIIDLQWHQYIVKKWDTIIVDRMSNEVGESVTLSTVLAVFDEEWDNVSLWTPYLKKAKVTVKVLENKKGPKINVLKFKRKTRYERNYWFRPFQTILQVEELIS